MVALTPISWIGWELLGPKAQQIRPIMVCTRSHSVCPSYFWNDACIFCSGWLRLLKIAWNHSSIFRPKSSFTASGELEFLSPYQDQAGKSIQEKSSQYWESERIKNSTVVELTDQVTMCEREKTGASWFNLVQCNRHFLVFPLCQALF